MLFCLTETCNYLFYFSTTYHIQFSFTNILFLILSFLKIFRKKKLELKNKGEISRIKSFVFYNFQLLLLGWWTQEVLHIGNRDPQVSTKFRANWSLKRRKLSRNKLYTESCAFQGYYTDCSGKFLPNFRDNLSVPPSRVKNTNI